MASLRDRILHVVSDRSAMSSAASVFEEAVASRHDAIQCLIDSLETEDATSFHICLQQEIDHPAFDEAFRRACAANPDMADHALSEALRGASVVSGRGSRPECEAITDLFFLPVTGTPSDIRALVADPESMTALEASFRLSALATEEATLTLSDTPLRPDFVVNSTPASLRRIARAFEDFVKSGKTSGARAELEGDMADFETLCTPDTASACPKGTVTVLLAASYTREFDLTAEVDLDGLTVHLANEDPDSEFAEEMACFLDNARDATGLVVGKPHWLGRACAAAAVQAVYASLSAEAAFYGVDLGQRPLEGIAFAAKGEVTMVVGEVAGRTLGPFAFDTSLARHEPDWPAVQFESMAYQTMPSGHIENSRSAMLN